MMLWIADDELNAYVDGALDPCRALAVATFLAAHPRDAARAEAYRAQHHWLHALLDPVIAEPVPDRLNRPPRRHDARSKWLRRVGAMAALAMALAALGLGGRAMQARFSVFDAVLSAPPHDAPAAAGRHGRLIRI